MLAHGFARVRCQSCKDELLVAFSSDVLTVFLRAVFALQRRRSRRQSIRHGQVGAVSFIQFFGSALQVTPNFHSLVPDGVFVPGEDDLRFEALPPPTQAEVERLLRVVCHRVLRLLEKRGPCPPKGLRTRGRRTSAAMGRVARWRWSDCRGWRMAASRTG
ncbi:hypothetical protein BHS06_14195 [Myxococcus xanthus]|uniref:transposase n=1 Tax=Myxococcus xanthus TaxID=34 RepID=UPI0011635752|nr:transposase [Myxococcus xanthus]QDE90023.1 hypothetical protein BHS06_14195 [Myxococcus xanthus]